MGQRACASLKAGGCRRQVLVCGDGTRQLHESPLAERPPGRTRGVRYAAGSGNRSSFYGANVRLDVAELELAGHVGLGLPCAGHVCRAARQARSSCRRAVARHPEKRLPREWPQPSASRAHDLSAGERWTAHGRGHDGGRLGRRARWPCSGISQRWIVDGALERIEGDAVGWVEFEETHRPDDYAQLVGLGGLDPPYKNSGNPTSCHGAGGGAMMSTSSRVIGWLKPSWRAWSAMARRRSSSNCSPKGSFAPY